MASIAGNSLQHALEMGLTASEYSQIEEMMGRAPSPTELGMFAVMWSEHCGYKFSRPVLSYFSEYKKAMEAGSLENAGLVPYTDELALTFKIESHNHPSAVEPYQGAATGVGGILRDIFTMGARPIAGLNSLRFGPIEPDEKTSEAQARRNRYLFDRVVRGIGDYGNCVGVPTIGGEVAFHWRFSGNPLVNAMCIGVVRKDSVATAVASGPGNAVIYLGSATGRDGIHGASFASQALDDASEAKRPNVQIGDPFAGKQLIEATLESLASGAVLAIQDMGAAGLTCSTIEMSAKGHVGMEIDLDKVPAREDDMSAYELMLSESQERMLCVAQPGREQEILDIFHKWGLKAEVIGHVTEHQKVIIRRRGIIEADVTPSFLAEDCPIYAMNPSEPAYFAKAQAWDPIQLPQKDLAKALRTLLGHPNIASKRFVYQQYDQEVQAQTAVSAGEADAAVLKPRGILEGIAAVIDGNSRWTYFDPYQGGLAAVCEAARNLACVGAKAAGITDGLNFGNPQKPEVFWQFERAVRGIADAASTLKLPVVSGNVSFYNESEAGGEVLEVLPTPLIGMVGILPNADRRATPKLTSADHDLFIVCPEEPNWRQDGLGASLYAESLGVADGVPVRQDLTHEAALCRYLVQTIQDGKVAHAHDVSEGGIAVTLAEMSMGGVGVDVELEAWMEHFGSVAGALFGEASGAVVIAAKPEDAAHLAMLSANHQLNLVRIGGCILGSFRVKMSGEVLLDEDCESLRQIWERAIPQVML